MVLRKLERRKMAAYCGRRKTTLVASTWWQFMEEGRHFPVRRGKALARGGKTQSRTTRIDQGWQFLAAADLSDRRNARMLVACQCSQCNQCKRLGYKSCLMHGYTVVQS